MKSTIILTFLVSMGMSFPVAAEKFSCTGMEWPHQIASIQENVAAGCVEVIEENGDKYGIFEATFLNFKAGDVTLLFKMPEGENVVQTFHPPEDLLVEVEGKQRPFSELERGQSVTLFIPEAE